MKKSKSCTMLKNIKLLSFILLALMLFSCSQKSSTEIHIIPKPIQTEQHPGKFKLRKESTISIPSIEYQTAAELFNKSLKQLAGFELEISVGGNADKGLNILIDKNLEEEEYTLEINENIILKAANYNGLTRGLSTLVQLIPTESSSLNFPKLSIQDKPDYAYRGVLLDLARFWQPVETVKETIDLLWYYKIPYLQLHLSDNRRFTFPLDEFPKLKTIRENGKREYYTREELNDIVEYARQRGVFIIPEVELPGHSAQLFTKYPDIFGSIDPKTGKAQYIHVINMAKEEAYIASEKIIQKLSEVFYTSPYIHIGCDEVYLEVLKSVPEYKAFCRKHDLKEALNGNANELFCYFINRLHKMVKANGKQSIIWEGFHGNGAGSQTIPTEIPVIVWNTSYNHPDSLVSNGYQIINSTWIPWYMVGAMNLAPIPEKGLDWDVNKWGHWNANMSDVEIPENNATLGGQICYWEQNHYKVIPVLRERVPVLAERLWNNDYKTNYESFLKSYAGINKSYGLLFRPLSMQAENLLSDEDLRFNDAAVISLKNHLNEGIIKYVLSDEWDMPDFESFTKYTDPFSINESTVITAQVFDEQGNPVGYPIQQYFQKIVPAYEYRVLGPTPDKPWDKMPDFDQLEVLREGYTGLMTPERLDKINGELFAKVKTKGHIEVRFNGIYNPYALDLKGSIQIPKDDEYVFRIQTHDGLAELYIDGKAVGIGKEFGNKPEDFTVQLTSGSHNFQIKYFYQNIQNQLSIEYKDSGMDHFEVFEELVQTIQ